jgi:Peptidase family M41
VSDVAERATAIHEAGHAVMAYLLRRPFTSVSVVEDDESYGRVHIGAPGKWFRPDIEIDSRTRSLIEDRIMISFAGPELERITLGHQEWVAGCEYDLHQAVNLASYMTGPEAETSAYCEWLLQRTIAAIGQPRFRVLADALTSCPARCRHADLALVQGRSAGRRPAIQGTADIHVALADRHVRMTALTVVAVLVAVPCGARAFRRVRTAPMTCGNALRGTGRNCPRCHS